jgi:hypothetical protein
MVYREMRVEVKMGRKIKNLIKNLANFKRLEFEEEGGGGKNFCTKS